MKKTIALLSILIMVFLLNKIASNPLLDYTFNEFLFDSTGWKIELHSSSGFQEDSTLDGWSLSSKTDTAYFKNGIHIDFSGYTVITSDSLQSELNIDPLGDALTLSDGNSYVDWLSFGNSSGTISSPKEGQSIRLYGQEFVLDNTPTMGFENDTSNIFGYIEGYINDSLSNAIPEVMITYDWNFTYEFPERTWSDSSGYFKIKKCSKRLILLFEKDGYNKPDTLVQVWPDSTVAINIEMSIVVGITEITPSTLNKFELTQNFPNPFNGSTSFFYFLPADEELEIIIYDQKGEIVQKLFKGFQSKGQYRINWNANEMASGIYFYELKTGNRKLVKKCLLLK